MNISDSLITHLEELSKIQLSNPERTQIKDDLQQILTYMSRFAESDNMEQPDFSGPENVFREDIPQTSADREAILRNASTQKNGCFLVPRTFE